MAVTTKIKSAAVGAGAAFGSFGIFSLIAVVFVGVLILSLIPLYLSNTSQEGSGDIYRISALMVKALYSNVTGNFTGGSVLNTAELSRICTAILRAKNVRDLRACIATNFVAYGPANDTSGYTGLRRRRAPDYAALYEIGDILLLFSNTCSNRRGIGQWFQMLFANQNSSCLARRATACRAFVTTPNNLFATNQWSPFPFGYSQVVVTNGSVCTSIGISQMYNVAPSWYPYVYNRFNITRPLGVRFGDCKLDSIQSQAYMQSLIDSTMYPLTFQCTSAIG